MPPALDVIAGPSIRFYHTAAAVTIQASWLERPGIEPGAARIDEPAVDTIETPQQFAYHALRIIN